MRNMSSKNKLKVLKIFGIALDVVILFGVTALFVLLNIDKLWNNIPSEGITSFPQWITLVVYRILIYLAPAIILSLFRFDKRYKYLTRLIIWLNWTLFIYLLCNVTIKVLGIDMVIKVSIFNSLDSVVLLMGYIITFFNKKKVEFDSTGTIIG